MHRKVWVPMQRSSKSPQFLARSNAWGMGLAFAPFPGQIPVVFGLWILLRRTKWRFSLAIAVAWTFLSNVFTNIPLFYLYYVTGSFLLNHTNQVSYEEWQKALLQEPWNTLGTMSGYYLLGSCFYMIIFAFLGYGIGIYHKKILKFIFILQTVISFVNTL